MHSIQNFKQNHYTSGCSVRKQIFFLQIAVGHVFNRRIEKFYFEHNLSITVSIFFIAVKINEALPESRRTIATGLSIPGP